MADCTCHSHSGFLTSRGLREVAQRTSLEGLLPLGAVDRGEVVPYFDRVVSVSGLRRDEIHWPCDLQIDEQHRRFLNGS